MYIVSIENIGVSTIIHDVNEKLKSGKVVKGINTIDTFSFSMLPDNIGFNLINDFTTLVYVYNTNKSNYEFIGRVLYAETTMDESGSISKNVTCESIAGYLCDSVQEYVDTTNWTVKGLLQHLIDTHNSQVESYKRFTLGEVTVEDSNDNLYVGIQRENTWDSITSNLINILGGELQFRVQDDVIYIDYLIQIGEEKETEIALSVNMKSITREQDPTAYVTRLIPLGCKLTKTDEETGEEVESEERLDITSVNNGVKYIDDESAISVYGIHVGVVTWDDVTETGNLYNKGVAWLKENNKVQIKYTITALDLSLIGLAKDDFSIGNTHPVINQLIGIDDKVRIIKETVDICEEIKSTIEVGDNFKTLSDIQRETYTQLNSILFNYMKLQQAGVSLAKQAEKANSDIQDLQQADVDFGLLAEDIVEDYTSEIKQLNDSISLSVSGSLGNTAKIVLSKSGNDQSYDLDLTQVRKAFADDPTAISISAGIITFNSNTIVINSTNFAVTSEGVITAKSGTVGAITLHESGIYSHNESYSRSYAGWYRPETILTTTTCFFAGASDQFGTNAKFLVTYGGSLKATDATISGEIITEDSPYKAKLSSGGLELYYNDVLCGTLNTKYWSGASTEGISLRIEEGGNYIMFSHPSSDYAAGFEVDYYLNYGWSSNYDEMHIFQTTARFLDKTYHTYSPTVSSDRNIKNSIESLPEDYEIFFDNLQPVRFKHNQENTERYHLGYIAQDVFVALQDAGLNRLDFAGYYDTAKNGELGLAYEEFIALLHLKIKKLQERIVALESGN